MGFGLIARKDDAGLSHPPPHPPPNPPHPPTHTLQHHTGSKLPAGPSQATWKAGAAVEVGWTVMANHGGGYQYRLARADDPLTEKTFQEMPLAL